MIQEVKKLALPMGVWQQAVKDALNFSGVNTGTVLCNLND